MFVKGCSFYLRRISKNPVFPLHFLKRRRNNMKKRIEVIMILAFLALFSFGCAGVSKEAKIKCPKCGAVFTVDEGLREHETKGY